MRSGSLGSIRPRHVYAALVFDEPGVSDAPYLSIDDIFDDIEATLNNDIVPVEVECDPDLGLPQRYTFTGPEFALDGGSVLFVELFTADPAAVPQPQP